MGITMWDKQEAFHNDEQSSPSSRNQQLIELFGNLWQNADVPSPDILKRSVGLVVSLPEPYHIVGFQPIAEYIVNTMNLHFLDVVATFIEKAEEEGIDLAEREGTLEDTFPQWSETMASLGSCITVRSLDDLVNLSNITLSLQKLYTAVSAQDAQSILYELPQLYWDQLVEKHLLSSSSKHMASRQLNQDI